jgi:glucuronate isomerase
MKHFIEEDFLLHSDFAKKLYHNHVSKLPIIDYHCHLPPQDIADNRQFENLTSIWLEGDHYKWRAMRALGIAEKYITGNATPVEKFKQWAYTVPYTLRNPLYHWTHLELKRYFEVSELLTPETGDKIFQQCSEKLQTGTFATQQLLEKMKVEVVCTTDDPSDDLQHHIKIKGNKLKTKVLPTFRPDKVYAIENPTLYNAYLDRLSGVTGKSIESFVDLMQVLENRIEFFHSNGCRLSDHGLEHIYYPDKNHALNIDQLFLKVRKKGVLDKTEQNYFKYSVLINLCRLYHKKGWTQQFHLGALRNTNERMLKTLGPDTGFDSIGDYQQSISLSRFLNELDSTNQLAKTILYNLNPADNEVMATMIGNYNDGSIKGKMQFGSAWWFLDQKDGMEKQINSLSNLGLLSCFIGMITDSRSFLSYPRHEYFRRILCNLLGQDVENGELPMDEKWIGKIASDICYHNAKDYFRF